jgi:hypothetical protein
MWSQKGKSQRRNTIGKKERQHDTSESQQSTEMGINDNEDNESPKNSEERL